MLRIKIRVRGSDLTATLIDSPTSRDFVSLLPLTLTMNDLFGREKFGHLPRAIAEGGTRSRNYEVGDVIYWSPGPDVAIYYRHDGQSIPAPGIIVVGKVDRRKSRLQVGGGADSDAGGAQQQEYEPSGHNRQDDEQGANQRRCQSRDEADSTALSLRQ